MADENKKAGKELLSELKEALNIQGDFRDILKDSVKELQKSLSTYDKIAARLENLSKTSINIKNVNADILKNRLSAYTNEKKIADLNSKLTEKQKKDAQKFNDQIKKIQESEALRIKYVGASDKRKEAAILRILSLQEAELERQKRSLSLNELSYAQALKSGELYKETEGRLKEELRIEKEVNKQLGLSGGLMQKFAQKLGVGEDVYEAMVLKSRELVHENDKATIGGKWSVLVAGVKVAGKAIKENLNDPMIQFGLIMKANDLVFSVIKNAFSIAKSLVEKILGLITGWNTAVFEFAKNLGVGEQKSRQMMEHFLDMSTNSGKLFLSVKGLSEAYTSMSESLGFMAPMNDEMLQTSILLQRQYGLTAEHINSINENSALSGKTFKDTFDTMSAINKIEGGRNKIMMSERQLIGEMAKVSSLVLMNFKGNVPALTAAVVRAKALGLTLEQVNSTMTGFLDFEGSISKEFEAQLLTGKDLNLQRLRYLSLTHDTAGLMAEIGKRIPSMLEFERMNTIERQSYAEAMNMSEESLAEIIKKQEVARKLGLDQSIDASKMYDALLKSGLSQSEAVEKMKEAGAQQYLNTSMTEKMSSFIDRIKLTLGQMLEGELKGSIDSFFNLISNGKKFHDIIEKVRGVVSSIGKFFADLPNRIRQLLEMASTFFTVLAAAEGALSIVAFATGNVAAGLALGAGAVKMGAAAYAASKGAGAVAEMQSAVTVSPAAATNQAGSSIAYSSAATGGTGYGQPNITLYANQPVVVDGQYMTQPVLKKVQFSHADNTSGQYAKGINTSVSGQTQ